MATGASFGCRRPELPILIYQVCSSLTMCIIINVGPWWWKANPKRFWIMTCTMIRSCYIYYGVFCPLFILEYPEHWHFVLDVIWECELQLTVRNIWWELALVRQDIDNMSHIQFKLVKNWTFDWYYNLTPHRFTRCMTACYWHTLLTLTVLVTTIDALRHFETG